MNTLKTLFLFGLMALVAADDLYVLQEVDFEALASNDVEFKKYKDCVLNKAPCNELYGSYKAWNPRNGCELQQARFRQCCNSISQMQCEVIKAHLPEGMKQACRRCTVVQKRFGYLLFETLKTKYPEDYALFKQIYDPRNEYLEAMEKELDNYKTI